MLAFDDDIEVARPVLGNRSGSKTPLCSPTPTPRASSICSPSRSADSLSEAVTDVLVERGDRDVVHSVVKNAGARFSDAGFRMLVKRSAGDDDLATDCRHARRHPAAAFSGAAGKGLERGPRAPCRRKPASRHRHRRRGGGSRRRHSQRCPQRLAGFCRRAGGGRAAEPHPPDRRGRNLPICARSQIRGNRDRAVDPVRNADRRRRTRAARSGRGDRAHSRQGRRPVVDDDQSHPAAAGGRPRHVGERSR